MQPIRKVHEFKISLVILTTIISDSFRLKLSFSNKGKHLTKLFFLAYQIKIEFSPQQFTQLTWVLFVEYFSAEMSMCIV